MTLFSSVPICYDDFGPYLNVKTQIIFFCPFFFSFFFLIIIWDVYDILIILLFFINNMLFLFTCYFVFLAKMYFDLYILGIFSICFLN